MLADIKARFAPLPALGKFELVGRVEVGDQTEYRYWVHVGDATWLLQVALDTDAVKVERLQFDPL